MNEDKQLTRILGQSTDDGASSYYYLDAAKIDYAKVSIKYNQPQRANTYKLHISFNGGKEVLINDNFKDLKEIEELLSELVPAGINGCVTARGKELNADR